MMYNYEFSTYGLHNNLRFSDVWSRAQDFVADYKDSGVYDANSKISDASATTLFYLLYSNYGNSTAASSDITQFKYQIFTTIFEYGPAWEKKLEIQKNLRALTDTDIEEGNRNIYNKALNPDSVPTTDELDYISEQTVAKTKRSKLDGYRILYELINNDVTSQFLARFKKYFLQIVQPDRALIYWSEEEE